MDIALRRIFIIRSFPKDNTQYLRPMELGAYDGSYHSNDLLALCKLELIEKKRFFINKNSKGHWRFRLTQKGFKLKNTEIKKDNIALLRKKVLLRKNGLRARIVTSKKDH
jgi:hypothetical protein